ncbi:MAG: sigma-70 family RNA polymerase sigma factor [Acidobacteriia bacterium]|nr:sigma-70 family RNA polymerase sigma factor [Terriglobia bacterium]
MELLERFAADDMDAFETLFRQFQRDVYRWIMRIVRDPAAAEDLTVETFWRIYRSRARFDPKREFGAWARRIASNVALDHLRSAPRETELDEGRAADPAPDRAAQQGVREALCRAFRRLPAKLRAVAALALIEEQPQAVIAEALGISVATVKSREFRAVRLLRHSLRRMGVDL